MRVERLIVLLIVVVVLLAGCSEISNYIYNLKNNPPKAVLELSCADCLAPHTGFAPLHVFLSAHKSADPDGDITGFVWDLGNGGGIKRGTTVAHTYRSPGSYTITLTARDKGGKEDMASTEILVLKKGKEDRPNRKETDYVILAQTAPTIVELGGDYYITTILEAKQDLSHVNAVITVPQGIYITAGMEQFLWVRPRKGGVYHHRLEFEVYGSIPQGSVIRTEVKVVVDETTSEQLVMEVPIKGE